MYRNRQPAVKSFNVYKRYITDLHNNVAVPFSPRPLKAVMYSIKPVGYEGFEEVGTKKLIESLNHLLVGFKKGEMPPPYDWGIVLMETTQSSEDLRHLAIPSWELLMIFIPIYTWSGMKYTTHVTSSLLDSQEWDKLERWIHIVWMIWPPDTDNITEGLKHAMESLILHQPNAVGELVKLVEEWSKEHDADVPE